MLFNAWHALRTVRLVRHDGARPRRGARGFLAGDARADIGVKARAVEECDRYVSLRSVVDFSSSMGDSSMGVEGGAEGGAIELGVKACLGFQVTARRLAATVDDKQAIVGSVKGIAEAVAERMQAAPAAAKRATHYLGTDFAAGRSRASARVRTKQKGRVNCSI